MNLCEQDCNRPDCDCTIYYESWASQVKTYIILMMLSGIIGFFFGVTACR